ncbi:maestro heat-like repeat family member 5 [Saccopteryx leptura]|uniref:maestro heat-like repeat family member 5 n=1 Tax=Saccopteryx leptura TaxID=249018 RepID=UPI00339C0433
MDGQHSEKPRSHTTAYRTPSTVSQDPRISSLVSESMKEPSHRKAPQSSACKDKPTPPTTILLYKSRSSQAALMPQDHKTFLEEAYNSAICFKMFRDLSGSDPLRSKYITKKIKNMAHKAPNLVLEAIYDFFVDNPQISNRHKFRLFLVLETVIEASDSLPETWEKIFMKMALENMTKSTELEEVYQDAASNVLVAICKHSWRAVAQHLETEVLTGVFPHRSVLYVMGILTSERGVFSQEEKACWEEKLTKIAVKSVQFLNTDVWSKELQWALSKPDRTHREQPPEKAFLFIYYGLILQAEENSATVRTHLCTLLETSHEWPEQREGIALTVGLAAVRHLDHVWAVLEQFGRSTPIKCSLHSFSLKLPENLRWKWASSTILLAYGQMAAKAKAQILPWVDNVLSRMIFFFRYSSWDETLKHSFLAAIRMLVEAISRNSGAHSYQFSQLSELLECLMVLMEKEPKNTLCTSTRQQVMHVTCSLCKLRPTLDSEKKSRFLSVCLRSVLTLPELDVLEKHTCLFLEPPNIQVQAGCLHPFSSGGPRAVHPALPAAQTLYYETSTALDQMLQAFITQNPTAEELHFLLSHLYVWLASDKVHERQRAVKSCIGLLRFLCKNLHLDPKEDFKRMGQLMGMLGVLCQDPDVATQNFSLEGLGHLYELLMHQKGEPLQATTGDPLPPTLSQDSNHGDQRWTSGDQKLTPSVPRRMVLLKDRVLQLGSKQVIKKVMKYLTLAQLTDLVWTAVEGLGSTSPFHVQAASSMLLTAVQEHGAKLETVANLGRAIHLQLGSVRVPEAKENVLRAITLLARSHTPELVSAFLDFSVPLDSRSLLLWRALGTEPPVSRRVLAALLAWLQDRPLPTGTSDSSLQPQKTHLRSLAAMNTLHQLQRAPEYETTVRGAYPQLLLVLLAQLHYVLELNLPTEPQPGQKSQEAAAPSPQSCSMSLEALKSLLSTAGPWQTFAHLELLGSWDLFTTVDTYPQGVALLARAMVQGPSGQVTAVTQQLLPSLHRPQERERKVAILILNEFLYSPALLEVLSKEDALSRLAQCLQDPSPEVRVLSLQGLGNILFHPEKGSLLRGQLPSFLNAFFQSSEAVVVQVMGTVSDMLHRLGAYGAGAHSLAVAGNARSFFDDEREGVRAAAMALFGDLVAAVTGTEPRSLRTQVHQSMVPLLLHLKDRCPAVVMQAKSTLFRCWVLLRWRLPHTLFCALAWGRDLSARHFLWSCLMTHSQEEFSIHLSQALGYLQSRRHSLKIWAVLFLGYTVCYHPRAVSQALNNVDTKLLLCTFEDLKNDLEPSIREFATRHFRFLQEVAARGE